MRIPRPPIPLLVVLAPVLSLCAGPDLHAEEPAPKSEDAWRVELAQEAPVVPTDLWSLFLQGLRKQPAYRFAKAMDTETLKPVVDGWAEELGLRLTLKSYRFLTQVGGVEVPVGEGTCHLRDRRHPLKGGGKVRFYALEMRGKKGDRNVYRVPREKIAPLDFSVSTTVVFTHPILGREVNHFAVDRAKLGEILKRLFAMGGIELGADPLFDFSINAAADAQVVTMTARGRSVVECVAMAVEAAGWNITVNGKKPENGFYHTHFSTYRIYNSDRERLRCGPTIDLTKGDSPEGPAEVDSYRDRLKALVFEVGERFGKRPFRVVIGP